jgi:hypothetical protein
MFTVKCGVVKLMAEAAEVVEEGRAVIGCLAEMCLAVGEQGWGLRFAAGTGFKGKADFMHASTMHIPTSILGSADEGVAGGMCECVCGGAGGRA